MNLTIYRLCFIKPWTLYCAMLWLHLIRSTFPFIQLCPFFWERNWQLWHSCTLEEEPFFWTLSNPLPRQRGTQARNPHWTKLHFSRISSGDDLLICLHVWRLQSNERYINFEFCKTQDTIPTKNCFFSIIENHFFFQGVFFSEYSVLMFSIHKRVMMAYIWYRHQSP